jgi:hypothetical protein
MKKNMIIGVVLFIICLTNSVAQDVAVVNASVAGSFERNFAGASQPRWTFYDKNITMARFKFMDRAWLAYFNNEGQIISSGRKVAVQELPAAVGQGMAAAKQKNEKKYGALSLGVIYEMVTSGEKAYFIPLVNGNIHLLLSIDLDGAIELKRKTKGISVTGNANVIARTNE